MNCSRRVQGLDASGEVDLERPAEETGLIENATSEPFRTMERVLLRSFL